MEEFRKGTHRYFRELVVRYGPLVLGVARAYGRDGDHVDDLFQEVWRRVYERRGSFCGTGSFEAWLHRVATRVCIGDYRGRRARSRSLDRFAREPETQASGAREPGPLEETERRELRARLHRALACLTERELEAITLKLLDGLTTEEAARRMGVTRATVRSTLRNGLARLRASLEREGHDLSGP